MATRQSTTCWFVCGTHHTWSIIMIFTSIFRFCFTSFPKKFKWTTAFETVDSVSASSVVETRVAFTLVNVCNRMISKHTSKLGRTLMIKVKKCKSAIQRLKIAIFKPRANRRKNSQQCWELLANNIASVCTVLKAWQLDWSVLNFQQWPPPVSASSVVETRVAFTLVNICNRMISKHASKLGRTRMIKVKKCKIVAS